MANIHCGLLDSSKRTKVSENPLHTISHYMVFMLIQFESIRLSNHHRIGRKTEYNRRRKEKSSTTSKQNAIEKINNSTTGDSWIGYLCFTIKYRPIARNMRNSFYRCVCVFLLFCCISHAYKMSLSIVMACARALTKKAGEKLIKILLVAAFHSINYQVKRKTFWTHTQNGNYWRDLWMRIVENLPMPQMMRTTKLHK